MSFIVKGKYKPQQCQKWQNSRYKRCWFLDDNDNCTLQKGVHGRSWEEQYAGCPILNIKRKHGALIDSDRNEVVLEAEDDTIGWWRKG